MLDIITLPSRSMFYLSPLCSMLDRKSTLGCSRGLPCPLASGWVWGTQQDNHSVKDLSLAVSLHQRLHSSQKQPWPSNSLLWSLGTSTLTLLWWDWSWALLFLAPGRLYYPSCLPYSPPTILEINPLIIYIQMIKCESAFCFWLGPWVEWYFALLNLLS